MDIFSLRNRVVDTYADYIKSFLAIRDARIRDHVDSELERGRLWPEPLVQLNPTFKQGKSFDDLIKEKVLHPRCSQIFRIKPDAETDNGPIRLHQHQEDAVRAAYAGDNYVLTTGTGSGKSLSYIIPIVDHVLRTGSGQGIRAIVVYPMNALANSQVGELDKFLHHGFPEGHPPVTYARYTGQESQDDRKQIIENPPDILLTNYVMLELVLTRPQERKLVEAASNLRFLVLDELHTYRGRQGSDVSMLVRRVRETAKARDMLSEADLAVLSLSEINWQVFNSLFRDA